MSEVMKDSVSVIFEADKNRSAAYVDGSLIGECEFEVSENKWIITHTGVRTGYEGRGIARRLVQCVIEEARKKGAKILPICSYAKKMMTGKDEYRDILIEE